MQLVGRKGEVRGIPVASAEGSHFLLLLGAGMVIQFEGTTTDIRSSGSNPWFKR